jgi:bifunctional DNase/RNase
MLRRMVISVLAVDQLRETPVVILKEVGGDRTLPIWIGFLEAMAIASELQGIKFSRPLTHDLLKGIMGLTEVKVRKRVNARIFAAEEVIQKSRQIDLKVDLEGKSERGKKWHEILEELNQGDFGKYRK